MTWVMALTREATPEDDQTWSIVTYPDKPAENVGEFVKIDGLHWLIEDIFRDGGS